MNDDLNHIIRSSFEGSSSEGAPDSIWSSINNELTQDGVDSVVKESFEAQNDTAPELVWDRVQDQLDIDRVWNRVSDKIFIKRYGYVLRAACVLVILMLPFALDYDILSSSATTSPTGQVNQSNEITNELIGANVLSSQNTIEGQELVGNEVVLNRATLFASSGQSSSTEGTNNKILPSENPAVKKEKEPVNVIDRMSVVSSLNTRPITSLTQSSSDGLRPFFAPEAKRSLGLVVGGVASLDNTWIIDNDTRSGFDSESLVHNKISLGSSYGVFAEYQFGRKYSITAEYLFQSQSKQHQRAYDKEGIYTHKEREINAYKFALMATRYTQPKFHRVNHSTLFRFGGYFSSVKSDYTYLNDVITNVNSIYRRNDLGLRMEIGERIYMKSFVIEAGLKGEFGLTNLASYKSQIAANLNFTRLVSGGAYVRIGYAF